MGVGGNPDLKDEEGWTADAGFEGEAGKKWILFYDLGYYVNQVNNWILWIPQSDGIWRVTNRDRVLAQGTEVNMGVRRNGRKMGVEVRAMYNYQFTETDEGYQLIYTPQHRARINLEARWLDYYLRYDHSYTGTRYINPENTIWMPDYFLADLRIGWKKKFWKKHRIGMEGGVLNLFDEPYQNIANRPMPGRNYFLKFRYEWL
ncbi:TonB-dependent receptor [bacterium SCSIO 12741]|nr:TonB-dependent receptor [bacterium SCSIO 12741]